MEELLTLLKERGFTIGSCESLTAGLFTSQLAAVSGASAVLKGGIVTYQTVVKKQVVGVDAQVIEQEGVVSAACAVEMACKTKKLLACDICVSFSGNAGPDIMEGKPVGRVYCAIAYQDEVFPYCLQLSGSRNEIRMQAVMQMKTELIRLLTNDKGANPGGRTKENEKECGTARK